MPIRLRSGHSTLLIIEWLATSERNINERVEWKWWESNPRTERKLPNVYKLISGLPERMDSLVSEIPR